MDKQPVVALGEKVRGTSLGERVRSHLYNHRGAYISALTGAAAVGLGVATPFLGAHELRSAIERGARRSPAETGDRFRAYMHGSHQNFGVGGERRVVDNALHHALLG